MGCNCGGSKQTAQDRLAARRAAVKRKPEGTKEPTTFWNGRRKTKPQPAS